MKTPSSSAISPFACLVVLCIAPCSLLQACTTAVLSGRCTPDGRPMLWKHRDTSDLQNRLAWFSDGVYEYLALVNTDDVEGTQAWAGVNSAGFAVMNSASYNLNAKNDKTDKKDQEGVVMKAALQACATVDDFERLLKQWPRPMGVEANFGAIDAQGNAAFFETSNHGYVKIDVCDPEQAPAGYVIRSNYSVSGRADDGMGYIRYQAAEQLFARAAASDSLNPRFLVKDASRCLKHSLTRRDLREEATALSAGTSNWVTFRDYIPRKSSTSAIVVQGVQPDEDPRLCTAWTVLGFPLTSIAVPIWVGAGPALPQILQSQRSEAKDKVAEESAPAPLCDLSLRLKARCFPIRRGNGAYYLDLPQLINRDNTGLLQRIDPIETRVLDKAESLMSTWRDTGIDTTQAQEFYRWVDTRLFEELCAATAD